jgi:hypothetical protein
MHFTSITISVLYSAATALLQLLEAFEPNGVSTWVPWRLTPPLLSGLTAAYGSAQLLPGENTAWAWVKAGVAMMEAYQPDVSGGMLYAYAWLGLKLQNCQRRVCNLLVTSTMRVVQMLPIVATTPPGLG